MESTNSKSALTNDEIKAIRLRRGLSQQEFGTRLGVTHAHISKIESGKEKPSQTLLKLIEYEFDTKSKVLEVPAREESLEKIRKYISAFATIFEQKPFSDNSFLSIEFMFTAILSVMEAIPPQSSFADLFLEAYSGVIDEMSSLLCDKPTKGKNASLIFESKLASAKSEIEDCLMNIYKLTREFEK